MKKNLFFILIIFSFFTINVYADDGEITSKCNITVNDKSYPRLTDTKYTTYNGFTSDEVIKIICDENISHLYIYYDKKSSKGSINNKYSVGENGYLHELIKIDNKTSELIINYDESYAISEIFVFNTDNLPSWVEDWQTLDRADLMLFSTHADDEQLFFAGLMPTYVDKGYKIQVIYFTNHYNNTNRYHEQLEGLWAVGIKYYPVISTFPDAYSTSLNDAIAILERSGNKTSDALKFETEQIRKYKPYVVVGHDENGEYGHGQHILCTYLLKDAILNANDPNYDTQSVEKYGLWDISKLYLHLYNDKQILLDYDLPLKAFDGKTAYEVSKLGYAKHYSQQYTWFTPWLNGENNEYTSATQITKYNPAIYGLYYSSVGDDVQKNDMFENVVMKESSINIIDNTKKVIKDFKKIINKSKYYKYIGISLIAVAIAGLLGIFSGSKRR